MPDLQFRSQTQFGRGQNSVAAATQVRADELVLLQDGRASLDGSWVEPRGGSQRTHVVELNSGAAGLGGTEFTTAAGVQQLVVFVGNSMYYSTDRGLNWTQGATGLSTTREWSLARMRVGASNYLFCANGVQLYSWNGTTWAAVTGTGAPTTAKYIAVFNNRLWAAGHSGIFVAASRVADPISATAWDTNQGALAIQAQTHDNDLNPTGLFPLGSILLVFKRGSMGYVEGFGAQTLFTQLGHRGVSQSVGCVAHRTIQAVDNDAICFLSERGLEYYTIGANEPVCVTTAIQDVIERISWGSIQDADGLPSAVYWPLKREYQCAVPIDGSTSNNARIVFRPPNEVSRVPMLALFTASVLAEDQGTLQVDGNGYLELVSGEGGLLYATDSNGYMLLSPTGSYVEVEVGYLQPYLPDYAIQTLFSADRETEFSRPYAVGYDGFVRALELGTLDDVFPTGNAGVPVTMAVEFRPFHLGMPFDRKKAARVRLTALAEAEVTANVAVYADDALASVKELTFPAGAAVPSPQLGRVTGRGHYHRIRVTVSGAIQVHGVELGVDIRRRGA